MKQLRRIKGINFNYDLPDHIFVVGLDKDGVPEIQKIDVLGLNDNKLLKLKQKVRVKAISKMHWDAVCKSEGKKTLPYKSLSLNPARGYVFQDVRFAISRIGELRLTIEKQADEMMSKAASIAARHQKYIIELRERRAV